MNALSYNLFVIWTCSLQIVQLHERDSLSNQEILQSVEPKKEYVSETQKPSFTVMLWSWISLLLFQQQDTLNTKQVHQELALTSLFYTFHIAKKLKPQISVNGIGQDLFTGSSQKAYTTVTHEYPSQESTSLVKAKSFSAEKWVVISWLSSNGSFH